MVGRVWRGVALAVAFFASVLVAGGAWAEPVRCQIGAFVTSVSQVDTAGGTFRADFWMWSVCPTKDIEPLKTVEFLNGVDTSASLDSMIQRGDKWWATRKFSGEFRQDFSLEDYPFDAQPLVIEIEEGVLDSRDLVYVADTHNSGMDPAVELPGWRLKDFKVSGGINTHPTSFGDPSLPDGDSNYAALKMQVGVERARFGNFIKATFSLYITALLALISLFIVDGRPGLLGATMFAVVLSFVSVERVVGPHDGLYLLDQLHFAALALIMATTAWGVHSLRITHADPATLAGQGRKDVKAALILLGLYVVVNAVLIGRAVFSGNG